MGGTNIQQTWKPYLEAGEEVEREFLLLLLEIDPEAKKIEGNYKYADFDLPKFQVMVELKRDLKSDGTGNFAIEYFFKENLSGIAATKASVWVMADKLKFYCFSTEKLKAFISTNKQYLKRVRGGDNNDATMVLVDKYDIVNKPFCSAIYRQNADVSLLKAFFTYL